MGYEAPELTKADVLAAITDDDTRYSGADIDAAISSVGGAPLTMIEIWSAPETTITIASSAADKALNDVVIPDLGTYTILKAYARMQILQFANDAVGENRFATTTYIQVDKAAAGYINAIEIGADTIRLAAAAQLMGFLDVTGDIDISSRVANNATTNFKWADAIAADSNIYCRAIRTGVRLIVS